MYAMAAVRVLILDSRCFWTEEQRLGIGLSRSTSRSSSSASFICFMRRRSCSLARSRFCSLSPVVEEDNEDVRFFRFFPSSDQTLSWLQSSLEDVSRSPDSPSFVLSGRVYSDPLNTKSGARPKDDTKFDVPVVD